MSPLIWSLLLAAGAGFGIALWVRANLVVVHVSGQSMEPTFLDGDRVLVRRKALRTIRVGEVVVFRRPPAITSPVGGSVSRDAEPAALAGPVSLHSDPAMASRPVSRRGGAAAGVGARRHNPWMIKRLADVAGGQFAVLGDRPDRSFDSRHCGYLDESTLLGVVIRQL